MLHHRRQLTLISLPHPSAWLFYLLFTSPSILAILLSVCVESSKRLFQTAPEEEMQEVTTDAGVLVAALS